MKKIISVLLSVLMLITTITAVPFVSSAAEKTRYAQNDQYEYCVKNEKTVTITKYKNINYDGRIEIPNKIEGKSVVSIGQKAFYEAKIVSVKLPDSIESISEYAFSDCCNLEYVYLSKNLKRIDEHAFARCYSLNNIKIPNGVTKIGIGAFVQCQSLTSVKIPDCITVIQGDTFASCYALKSIELPKKIDKNRLLCI